MPTAIFQSKLQLFVEANELAGADGADVELWEDLSANGRDLEPVGAGGIAEIEAAAVNGKKSVKWLGGGIVPLGNTDTFRVRCGFLVAKISQATFNATRGLFSGIDAYPVLVGNNGATTFFDHQISDFYEYRLNDRIYSRAETWANGNLTKTHTPPAPMNTWGIIYFKFWDSIIFDGIQLGRDRDFSGRELIGEVALMALYDRDFCEDDIRKMHQSLAYAYDIDLNETYPFRGSRNDEVAGGKDVLSDNQREAVVSVIGAQRKTFSANFAIRSMMDVRKERAFYDEHYPGDAFLYRDLNIIPPEDTPVKYAVPSPRQFAENLNLSSWTREFTETAQAVETYTPTAAPTFPDEPSTIDEGFPGSGGGGGGDEILDGGEI